MEYTLQGDFAIIDLLLVAFHDDVSVPVGKTIDIFEEFIGAKNHSVLCLRVSFDFGVPSSGIFIEPYFFHERV